MPSKRQVREAEEEQQRIQLEALQIESEESENEVDQSSSIFAVVSNHHFSLLSVWKLI